MEMSYITFYLAQSVTEKLYNAYCKSTLSCGSAYFVYEYLSIMVSPLSSCVISYVPFQTNECSKVARASSTFSGRLYKMNWCYTEIKGHFSPLVLSLSTPPSQVCSVCPLRQINIAEMLWEQLCGSNITEHHCKTLIAVRACNFGWILFSACDAVFSSVTVFVWCKFIILDMWLDCSSVNNW